MGKGKERNGISIAQEHNACLHMEKKGSKNSSMCGKASSAGEHCAYPATEKSLEQMVQQMVQCRAGDWEEKLMAKTLDLAI